MPDMLKCVGEFHKMKNYFVYHTTFKCQISDIIHTDGTPIYNDLNLESTSVLHLNKKHLGWILT